MSEWRIYGNKTILLGVYYNQKQLEREFKKAVDSDTFATVEIFRTDNQFSLTNQYIAPWVSPETRRKIRA